MRSRNGYSTNRDVTSMESQRIILANVPRFLNEVLRRALSHATDLSIVGEVNDWSELSAAISRTGAHWIIVSQPPGAPMAQAVDALLATHPGIRALNVASDGGHLTLRWLEPHERDLDEFSLEELIALLANSPQPNAD